MIIAQISDTHIALDTPDSDQRIRDFERVVADINALNPAPDVIFHTGDVVHNGRPDEYAEAVRILDQAKAPIHVIPGNKDDRANLRAAFALRGTLAPGSDFVMYAVEDYPVRLIAVDTKNATSNKGDFCPERAKRLTDLIDADTTKPIAVFAHHPPFMVPVGPHPLNFETPEMMERLCQALQHSDRVKAVFCGHVHRQTEGHVGRIPVTVATAVATPLRKGDYPPEAEGRPIYYLHRFDDAGGFVTETRFAGVPALAEQDDNA
ncbi:MAG: metallophosphoesterase [Pseudolabrys sp.]